MQKELTLLFSHFETEHLGKDVFLVPYYLGKLMDYHVTIVYRKTETNKFFPTEIQGVSLVPLNICEDSDAHYFRFHMAFFAYLRKHASKIDCLMMFHHSTRTEYNAILFKMLNPKGMIYLKLDVGPMSITKYSESKSLIKRYLHRLFSRIAKCCINLATCETSEVYGMIQSSPYSFYHWGNKLMLMQNGFDETLLQSYHIREKTFVEKENIFITVGRLGTPPKNTSMILEALAKVDLKDWKFYLIGPMQEDFKREVEDFYTSHPGKKERVIFTGAIYDKKQLWEYYNRAKVFVLTSRWESYGLVLNEAKRFRNYILSTNIGAFEDLAENGKYGISINMEDASDLAIKMNQIICNEMKTDVYQQFDATSLSWEKQLKPVAERLLSIKK